MARFVVRFRGDGPRPEEVIRRLRQTPNTSVIDDSGRMLLVDAPPESVSQIFSPAPDWLVTPEQGYAVPDPQKRPKRAPGKDA